GLDPVTKAADVDVKGLGGSEPVTAPELIHDVLTANDTPGVLHQQEQQIELTGRKLEPNASDRGLTERRVDPDVADLDPAGRLAHGCSPQDGPDPSGQLSRRERLHDVVVRTELEANDAVDRLVLGRHDEDGDVRSRSNVPAHVAPVPVREHQVQDDDVRTPRLEVGDGG